MYQPDPKAVLRTLADRLTPGGAVAFLEYEHKPPTDPTMWPSSALVNQLARWIDDAWIALGNQARMGTRLPSLLRSAGLEPQLPHEVTGAVLTGVAVLEYLTAMMLGISPVLTAHGIANEEEIDIETFAERVSVDLGPDPVFVQGPNLGVWARKP